MDKLDAQYLFLLDFVDYLKNDSGTEILRDLKSYFPTEYDKLLKNLRMVEADKKLAALLHAGPM